MRHGRGPRAGRDPGRLAGRALYRKVGYAETFGTAMVNQLCARGGPETGTRTASNTTIEVQPIGFVRNDAEKVPRSFGVSGVEGTLQIDEAYREGLADIEPGQRIVVIFNIHESPAFATHHLRQTPPHLRQANRSKGVFSICSPVRPDQIGMSVLQVLGIDGTAVRVRGPDMRDGTPILDLKPSLETLDGPSTRQS